MNKDLVYSEFMRGSMKELDQLKNDLDKIIEYRINLHFRKLFQNDIMETHLKKCHFEGGTYLSRLL